MTPEKAATRHPICPKVPDHGPAMYFRNADAFACMSCDEWLEAGCDEPNCTYCKKRPGQPSLMTAS